MNTDDTLAALQSLYGDVETFDEGQRVHWRYIVRADDGRIRMVVQIEKAPQQDKLYHPAFLWALEVGPLGDIMHGGGNARRDKTRAEGWESYQAFEAKAWCQNILPKPQGKGNS